MGAERLIVLVGLTGAGKSTALKALRAYAKGALALPNRRRLADRIVIPEALRLAGEEPRSVTDRLERFRLTARYREAHPGGMAHALERYVADLEGSADGRQLLFDNLRGAEEVGYATDAFPAARFVVLEAPVAERVLRLAGRRDAFDRVAGAPPGGLELLERLRRVPGLGALTDLEDLAAAAEGLDADALETGARVVAEESLHYDSEAAWRCIAALPESRRIRLDTGQLTSRQVAARLRDWL